MPSPTPASAAPMPRSPSSGPLFLSGLRRGLSDAVEMKQSVPGYGQAPDSQVSNHLNAFVEYRLDPRWPLRLTARNLASNPASRDDAPYVGLSLRWSLL